MCSLQRPALYSDLRRQYQPVRTPSSSVSCPALLVGAVRECWSTGLANALSLGPLSLFLRASLAKLTNGTVQRRSRALLQAADNV